MKRMIGGLAWITVVGAFVAAAIQTQRFFLETVHVASIDGRSWDETSFDYPFAVLFFVVCGLAPGLGLVAWGRPRGARTTAVGAVLIGVVALMVALGATVTDHVSRQPLILFAIFGLLPGGALIAWERPRGTRRIALGVAVIAAFACLGADGPLFSDFTTGEALEAVLGGFVLLAVPGLLLIAWGYTRLITIRWERRRVEGGDAERESATRTVCETCGASRRRRCIATTGRCRSSRMTPQSTGLRITGTRRTHTWTC